MLKFALTLFCSMHFYNENLEWDNPGEGIPYRQTAIGAMMKELYDEGLIDGIGAQMHIDRYYRETSSDGKSRSNLTDLFTFLKEMAQYGLQVHISELDVRTGVAYTELTPDDLNIQAAQFEKVVKFYMDYIPSNKRFGITFWGVTDKYSTYRASKQDSPLPLDDNYTAKKCYYSMRDYLKNR